jgi:Flp pilus assembly protein TadB
VKRPVGSRLLVAIVLLVGLGLVLLTRTVARSSRVQRMRADLVEVLGECRARYAAARSAPDSAAADAWRPPLGGAARPDDPPCGSYRRRNMLPDGSP